MRVKDGAAHLASLDRDREVYLDGTLVTRVADHPAFANGCRSAAALYDFQARPENVEWMTFDTGTGRRANRAWQMPRSYDDLVANRVAMTAWAEQHGGFMGRSPDHLSCCISGQIMGIEVFERHGARFADAYRDYYRYARDNDVFLTYVIINPQADRSKAWGDQASEDLTCRIVDEDGDGITVRGAKMLGTSAIMAEEIFVANLQPLQEGEEDLAVCFAMPLDAGGVKILSRKSYEQNAVTPWDNPLSYRFDENDALIYFDDVKVPWERVFVFRDIDMCRAQFHDTPGHVYQNYQAQIRYTVKMKFLLAIARRITETVGTIKMPAVRERLGQMASQIGVAEGLLYGMEAAGTRYGDYFVPKKSLLYAATAYTQGLYPQFVTEIRELAGGGLIMLPSSAADLADPELARLFDTVLVSAREGEDAYDRIKFFKLAWDAVGSEFASRHTQYEMFYNGAQFVTRGHTFRTYDWGGAERILDTFLEGNDTAWAAGGARGASRKGAE